MTHRQIASLACKVLGIYALIMAITASPALFYALNGDLSEAWYNVASLVILLIAGIGLIAFSRQLGSSLAKGDDDSAPATLRVGVGFEVVAIGLLGVFDLLQSIPALLNHVVWIATQDKPEWATRGGLWGEGLASSGLRVALGLWLLLGARGWANVLRKLRGVGLQTDEQPWNEGHSPVR